MLLLVFVSQSDNHHRVDCRSVSSCIYCNETKPTGRGTSTCHSILRLCQQIYPNTHGDIVSGMRVDHPDEIVCVVDMFACVCCSTKFASQNRRKTFDIKIVSTDKQSTASKYILNLVYTLYLTVVVTCVSHSHYIVYQFLFTVLLLLFYC